MWRKLEALRDRILSGCGTDEPWFLEDPKMFQGETGRVMISAQWRKPLSLAEVAQMAPTSEVRQRPGRP